MASGLMRKDNAGREPEGVMKAAVWAVSMIFAFSLITAALFTAFEIAIYSDFDVYEKEYEKYDVLSDLDMTMDDAMYVTHEMMDYLRGDRETLSVITDVDGERQDFFNGQDRFHMAEVRELFMGGLAIRAGACVSMALCLVLLVILKADMAGMLSRAWFYALAVAGGLAAVIGIAAAVDFNAVFVAFHNVFFDNDLWIFDPAEDYMIRMLPEGLFADMVVRIGTIFALLLAVFSAAAVAVRKALGRLREKDAHEMGSEE